MELFPGVFTNPVVTFFADIDGEKVLITIIHKLNNQLELDEMDAYNFALMHFFAYEKSREEILEFMCYFINDIEMSEVHKYIIKLIQVLSARAIFVDDKQEEFLGVIKMGSTYIDNYEKNLVKKAVANAVNDAINEIALKMKKAGADSQFIYECTGLRI